MITREELIKAYEEHGSRLMVYCSGCGDEYSADPSDYWQLRGDDIPDDHECGGTLILAVKHTSIEKVL